MQRSQGNYIYKWNYGNDGTRKKVFSRVNHTRETMRRRDLYFALDAEFVGVGEEGKESALARLTVINWDLAIVFHTYVKVEKPVTDYRHFVSGILPEQIEAKSALPLIKVQRIVSSILRGKILIGHGLENDLKVIGIQHPWCDIRDTAYYQPFMRKEQSKFDENCSALWFPRRLKELAKEILGRDIQVFGKPHCPIEDAIASMDLYKKVRYVWEASVTEKVNNTNNNTTTLVLRPIHVGPGGHSPRQMNYQNYDNRYPQCHNNNEQVPVVGNSPPPPPRQMNYQNYGTCSNLYPQSHSYINKQVPFQSPQYEYQQQQQQQFINTGNNALYVNEGTCGYLNVNVNFYHDNIHNIHNNIHNNMHNNIHNINENTFVIHSGQYFPYM